MLLQRIQQQFIDSADLKYQCAQSLAPAVEAATQEYAKRKFPEASARVRRKREDEEDE